MGATNNPRAVSPTLSTAEAIERRRKTLSLKLNPQGHHPHRSPTPPANWHEPTEPETPTPPQAHHFPTPAPAALYGLAGQAVRTIAPHTEADPAAILLQFLAAFGNLLGPGPHCMVESTRHRLNLFIVLVGESSKARKGTSWAHICRLFSEVDQPWATHRVTNARLNADGLIHALREEVPDRRLLVLAEEFASVLHLLGRHNGQLSPLLRCAWDSGHLRTLDRHHPLEATGTHISLIGHITQHELAPLIDRNQSHNGFANRCLWACVRRSQCLPQPSSLVSEDRSAVAREVRRSLDWAAEAAAKPFERSQRAQELWNDRYPVLSESLPGLHGAATSRAEAQVLRLSAIYAALDNSSVIEQLHLEAALAVWDYCSAAAGLFFQPAAEDEIAATIRRALDANPDGLSRDEIRKLFHGHISRERIDAALQHLALLGAATHYTQQGRGRSATMWEAATGEETAPE
jgi:hypothetical protein